MVRRPLLSLVALALAAAAAPATGAASRTATATYTGPGGVYGVVHGDIVVLGRFSFGAGTVTPRAGERTVEVSVRDATGLPVFFEAVQYAERRTFRLGRGCGKSDRPMRIPLQSHPVVVVVAAGACGSGVSVPTTGVVTATFR